MKQTILAACSFIAALTLGLSSCQKDQPKVPVKPVNPVDPVIPTPPVEKIEMPATISIEMHAGHLHGTNFHGNPSFSNIEFPDKGVQKVSFKLNADGKTYSIAEGNNPVRWKSHIIWSVEMVCRNKKGERINNNFVKNGAEDLFQLFITADNFRKYTPGSKTAGEPVTTTFDKVGAPFVYRDTNPEDEMYGHHHSGASKVTLSGKCVGLKGYFHNPATEQSFLGIKERYLTYDLHLRMVRFATPADKKHNGAYRPALAWDNAFTALTVFELTIPIRVFTQSPGDDEEDAYLEDLCAEFGIDRKKMEELYEESWNAPIEGEGAEHYHM